jgi:hypothetical protein
MADAVDRPGLFDSYAETGEVVATINIFLLKARAARQ